MEEIKSSVRKYDVNQQYKQSLKGPPHYYRVSVMSGYRTASSTITDAEFTIKLMPNQRMDMMNGEWHAFLEYFEADIPSQLDATNLKVSLPDLVRSSQDLVMTAADVCQTDDVVGHIPIAQEYRAPGVATYDVPEILGDGTRDEYAVPAVPADALTAKPIVIRNSIGADTIGVKIDPVALFSGKLRVLLRDANHTPVSAGAGGGEINPATEAWSATFLFVHKS
jgi:hypothetical protein